MGGSGRGKGLDVLVRGGLAWTLVHGMGMQRGSDPTDCRRHRPCRYLHPLPPQQVRQGTPMPTMPAITQPGPCSCLPQAPPLAPQPLFEPPSPSPPALPPFILSPFFVLRVERWSGWHPSLRLLPPCLTVLPYTCFSLPTSGCGPPGPCMSCRCTARLGTHASPHTWHPMLRRCGS